MISPQTYIDAARALAFEPTKSTAHMWHDERADAIAQMLCDLHQLASQDGCIAAGWALEKLLDVAGKARSQRVDA